MGGSFSQQGLPRPYGKYELVERIGHGGMAEIFRARLAGAAGFEKTVVIKRIRPDLARRPGAVEMFVAEAKLVADIQHRNIVQIFELGEHEGEFFLAMEYVKGTDLRGALKNATKHRIRVPAWFSVYVMTEVLDGLAYVHDLVDDSGAPRNVVHRDVTPSNVFLSHLGDIKLGDFGVAKDEAREVLTRIGQLKGKIPYMAPEQLTGGGVTRQTDIFAASVVLWECLTQRRLFGGRPDFATMELICASGRPPPSNVSTGISPDLDAILLKGLAIEPAERFASAREFQSALLDELVRLKASPRRDDVRDVLDALLGSVVAEGYDRLESDGGSDAHDLYESGESHEPFLTGEGDKTHPDGPADTDFDLAFAPGLDDTSSEGGSAPDESQKAIKVGPDWLVKSDQVNVVDGVFSDAETQRWAAHQVGCAEHQGSREFWVRDGSGRVVGPCGFEHMLSVLRSEVRAQGLPGLELSADQQEWMAVAPFANLVGYEALIRPDTQPLPTTSTIGSLENVGVIGVFARVTFVRATGRLIFQVKSPIDIARTEIFLLDGQPTHVYSSRPELQAPELLAGRGTVPRELLPEVFNGVVRDRAPIDRVVSSLLGSAPDLRLLIMKHRIADLFLWSEGQFAFDSSLEPPKSVRPFAPSLLCLVPELFASTVDPRRLERLTQGYKKAKFKPTGDFSAGLDAFGFVQQQREIARRLADGEKLSAVMKRLPEDQVLAVAYMLVQGNVLDKKV